MNPSILYPPYTISRTSQVQLRFIRFPRVVAVVTFSVSILTIIGWAFEIDVLKSINKDWTPMKPNAALAFICLSVSLFLISYNDKLSLALFLSGFALLIGAATLFEYFTDIDLGIDQLLFKDDYVIGAAAPGRMSAFASVCFVVTGSALLLRKKCNRALQLALNWACIIVFLLGLLKFNAYLFGAGQLYNELGFAHLALTASLLLMLFSLGVMSVLPGHGFLSVFGQPSKSSDIALKQLVTIFVLILLLSWIRLRGQQEGWYVTEIGLSIMSITSLCIITYVLWQGAFSINKAEVRNQKLNEQLAQVNEQLSTANSQLRAEIEKKNQALDKLRQRDKEITSKNETITLLNLTLEKKVDERTQQLQTVNKELESFTYSVSHDLRAPLRAVSGYANMLMEDYAGKLDAEAQRIINIIVNNSHMMGRLIDDLLKFSRMGRQELVKETIDVSALVRCTVDDLLLQSPTSVAEIHVDELQPCGGDISMLRQVWHNLISNAIKYSSKTASPKIAIGCMDMSDHVVYYVKDNGAGFDMAYADKLFGVFQRLHRSDEFEGNGVGLALSQRIIHKHNGKIWAEAEVGKGASFYFTLPKLKPPNKEIKYDQP